MTFDQLVCSYAIPRNHVFKYFQLRSFITSQIHSLEEPSMSAIERTTLNFKDNQS